MKRYLAFLITVLFLNLPALAARPIQIEGGYPLSEFMRNAQSKFPNKLKTLKIRGTSTLSQKAIDRLIENKIDAALIAGPIKYYLAKYKEPMNFEVVPVARGVLVPVVSRNVYVQGVKSLTPLELLQIWNGAISNWKKVGGPDGTIEVIGFRGALPSAFFETLSDEIRIENEPKTPGWGFEGDRNREAVEKSTGAISLLPPGQTSIQVRALGIKTDHGIRYPVPEMVQTGDYPGSFSINLVYRKSPDKNLQAFADFIKSPEGQQILAEIHLTPLYPTTKSSEK